MGRLWSMGFELNSLTSGVEGGASVGTASIQSSTVRSGVYAMLCNPSAAQAYYEYNFNGASGTSNAIYLREYIYITAFPSGDCYVLTFLTTGATRSIGVQFVQSTGKLRLTDSAGTAIGSDSPVLSLNTWYLVEAMQDDTNTTARARLDGVEFAASTSVAGANILVVAIARFGMSVSNVTGTMYVDDVAINDTSGSFQNSYPGAGQLRYLRPNAAGDANTYGDQRTGGTAGAGNDFTRVNEVTPDDATSFNGSSTLNQEGLYNLDDPGLNSYDTVNVIHVGGRFRNNTADPTATAKLEAEKTSGGTIAQSATIIPNTTTWNTNSPAIPRTYPLTLYQDPDGATIDPIGLANWQIGYKLTTAPGTVGRRIDFSAVWMLVDYTPGTPPVTNVGSTILMMGV